MNKKTNEHWPTVIIMEGRPYQLMKLERKGVNDPCSMCDLRQQCEPSDQHFNLMMLCKSDDRDDGWYFEEDWTIVSKQIIEFVEVPMDRQLQMDIENVVKHETHKELEG